MLQLRVLLYQLFDLLFEDLHFLPYCVHQVTLYQILKRVRKRACALGKQRSARPGQRCPPGAVPEPGLCPYGGCARTGSGSRLSPPHARAAPAAQRPRPPAQAPPPRAPAAASSGRRLPHFPPSRRPRAAAGDVRARRGQWAAELFIAGS